MRFRAAPVTARIATAADFSSSEQNFDVLRAWLKVAPDLFPERVDSAEPIRAGITPDTIESSRVARFGSVWYAVREKPPLLVSLRRGRRSHGTISIYAYNARDVVAGPDQVSELVDAWVALAAPDFGMVHHLCEAEALEAHRLGRSDLTGSPEVGFQSIWGFTPELRLGLPTLYWRTLLGEPYVAAFGRDRLRSLHAFSVIEFQWGFSVQLTARPPESQSYPEYRDIRESVIDQLGRDAFGVETGHPRAAAVPSFRDFPSAVSPYGDL